MKKAEFGRMFPALAPLMLFFMLACPLGLSADSPEAAAESYEETIRNWRKGRVERLTSDNGYLTLVGLEWLQQGENRLGSMDTSTIHIPGGPADWGTIIVDGDEIRYRPAAAAGILVDGEETAEATLLADSQGKPTLVSQGDLSFYVISRGSYALRIKNRNSEDRVGFTGISSYDIQPDWRMNARFTRAAEGQTIEIANVLGQSEPSPVLGTVEFERDGETYRLIGLGDEQSSSLWFLFADRTSGRETYGAGRFLYSDGLPENGRVVVDFNKAYNPPCAFNDYSTCPLPPQENRLKLAVTAGEKKYHD